MNDKNKQRLLKGIAMIISLLLSNLSVNGEVKDKLPISVKDMSYVELNQMGITNDNVNFRIGPSIEYDKLNTIKKGETIKIIAKMENGWYLVEYNNIYGFILSDYVQIIDFEKINNQIIMLPTIIKVLVANDEVNIREYPNKNSKIITKLKKGEKIIPLKYENGWYEVSNNNKKCYISNEGVKEISNVNGDYYKIVYCKCNTYIYDYPYNSVIAKLPQYEISKVYGEVEGYYLIESEGIAGYIKKSDCETLKDKYIIVDISSQRMILFEGINILLDSNVVTGKTLTPTDLGFYSIKHKEKNRILKGADYETFVKYWMEFHNGEGFHDASWRKKFGGEIYIKKGSHGCVNLPEQVASELYNNISVGDKVLIKK